jgi:branched-chain amino acid transport system permease protein
VIPERAFNAALLVGLVAIPLWAHWAGEAFTITLATRAAILALAAVGLNIALGYGGLVSLGHAAFFGIGGYAMGILAHHAQTYSAVATWPFLIEGTKSMPIIWAAAIAASALAAFLIGLLSLRSSGVYFIMITLAFGQMFFFFTLSWARYGGEDGLPIYLRNGFPGLDTLDPIQFYALCLGLLLAALWITGRLIRAPFVTFSCSLTLRIHIARWLSHFSGSSPSGSDCRFKPFS